MHPTLTMTPPITTVTPNRLPKAWASKALAPRCQKFTPPIVNCNYHLANLLPLPLLVLVSSQRVLQSTFLQLYLPRSNIIQPLQSPAWRLLTHKISLVLFLCWTLPEWSLASPLIVCTSLENHWVVVCLYSLVPGSTWKVDGWALFPWKLDSLLSFPDSGIWIP